MDPREALRAADRRFRERERELAADLAQARREREDAIRAAHEAGLTMREIAQAVGLSHQRVNQIIHER